LDIIAMSSVGAVLLQYHTKVKFVTDVPLVYTMGFMVISNKAFAKVSAEDQVVVKEVLSGVYSKYDKLNLEDDREAKEALFNAGLKRVVPTAAELERLAAVLRQANLEMAQDGVVSMEHYEEMMGYVEEYRSEHSASE
jgi:TRAP-type C4-dicarboxylate transport system substrate-binding protein